MTRVWGPSFPIGGFWCSPDPMAQDLRGQAPLGKSGVHCITRCPFSPQCPQEISLLTLPVFQGAAVSSEPPLWGSLEQLERPSPAGPPLQGTELAALSTPEASLERLFPVVDYLAAWRLLPNVSHWVMHTVEQAIAALCCHLSTGSLPRWWVPSRPW